MKELTLKDIFQSQELQQIQNSVSKSTGMAVHIVEMNGSATYPSSPTELYSEVIKKSDFASQKLLDCENNAVNQAFRTASPAVSVCANGLAVAAAPIVSKGKCLGAIVAGQVFVEKRDENGHRRAASELRVDEARYVNAAKKVKVMAKAQVDAIADTLFLMAHIFADSAYQKVAAVEQSKKLEKYFDNFKKSLEAAENLVDSNGSTVKNLTRKFDELNQLSDSATQKLENTTETVKVIQNIALNTRILGFNASIEASRAKESGKGFGVIAQEVRSLADVSKNSAEKIEEIIQSITETTSQIRTTIMETSNAVTQTFESMNSMTELLEKMKNLSDE